MFHILPPPYVGVHLGTALIVSQNVLVPCFLWL
jgi:hypothetical protein